MNRVKTWVLIAALGGLFVADRRRDRGQRRRRRSPWRSAWPSTSRCTGSRTKIAIATTRSKPVTEQEYPQLYRIVRELTQANRCRCRRSTSATWRSRTRSPPAAIPHHAVVAVTKGILQILDERELRGVLAHELSHVANRDILIGSIAAGIGDVDHVPRPVRVVLRRRRRPNNPLGPFGLLLAWILAPIAAAIIQMAVSRSREYQADESGALPLPRPAGAGRARSASSRRRPSRSRRRRRVQPGRGAPVHRESVRGRRGSAVRQPVLDAPARPKQRIERLQAIARELGTQIS